MQNKFYSVVTFGKSPSRKVFASVELAMKVARSAVGIGSCNCARVYECDTRELAKTADISEVRKGERIVWGS